MPPKVSKWCLVKGINVVLVEMKNSPQRKRKNSFFSSHEAISELPPVARMVKGLVILGLAFGVALLMLNASGPARGTAELSQTGGARSPSVQRAAAQRLLHKQLLRVRQICYCAYADTSVTLSRECQCTGVYTGSCARAAFRGISIRCTVAAASSSRPR